MLAAAARLAIAVDVKPILVQYARQEYDRSGIRVAAMDACRLAFADDSFDAIVADELLEHLREYRPFLDETVRVLQPDGLFVCATVNRAHTFGSPTNPLNPHHFFEFDETDFRTELSRYFSDVELLGQGFGEQFEKYNQHAAARAIEWLLVRLRVKQWLSPQLRMRVRSWLTGSDPGGDGDSQFVVSGERVDQAFYLVALCRGPRASGTGDQGVPSRQKGW
jgi:SAM-dependent methyltransferase